MKKLFLFNLFGFFLLSGISAQDKISNLLNYLNDPSVNYVFVVAHRGAYNYAPENSISGIGKSIELGADMVEIDIQKTSDGEFVLMHDGHVNRTTNGNGNVNSLTLAQLRLLRLRNPDGDLSAETVPTLREALLACKGKILVNIDKGGNFLTQIIPIIEETGTKDIVLLKSSQSVSDVKSMLGTSAFLFMPVVDLTSTNALPYVHSFLNDFKPVAVEVQFNTDHFAQLSFTSTIADSCRVFVNSLWASLCGGHEDEKALSDPDANWGWLLKQRATIIQTDRIKELIQYLESKGLRDLKTLTVRKAPEKDVPILDGKGSDSIHGCILWSR